jgi:hypothetical protein
VVCKHDKYLEDLCDKIKNDYDSIFTNVPLFSRSKKPRKIAEIDILAIRDNSCHIYEVKCSYRKTKAKRQLLKIKRIIPNIKRMFFFCGESGMLEAII